MALGDTNDDFLICSLYLYHRYLHTTMKVMFKNQLLGRVASIYNFFSYYSIEIVNFAILNELKNI